MFKNCLLRMQEGIKSLFKENRTVILDQTKLSGTFHLLWLFFSSQNNFFRKNKMIYFLLMLIMIFTYSCPTIFFTKTAVSAPITVRVAVNEQNSGILPNNRGIITKIFIDILEYIADEESWNLEFVYGNKIQCIQRLENNEIDIMVNVAFSEDKGKKYNFTNESVLLDWNEVFSKKNNPIETLFDIQKKKVAVLEESLYRDGENSIKNLTDRLGIECDFIETKNYQKIFELINSAKVDIGIVGKLFVDINENYNNVVKTKLVLNQRKLKYAFPKSTSTDHQLKNRIDYHLTNLKENNDSVYYTIINSAKNIVELKPEPGQKLKTTALTNEEKEWLKSHKTIRIGVDPAYAPYSFVDEKGNYCGVAIDFVDIINKKLNINMEVIPKESWSHIIESVHDNSLDVIVTAVKTTERAYFLGFTKIYIPTPLVIMSQEGDDRIYGPEDLSDKKIALVKGYSSTERIIREHPTIKRFYIDTPLDGLNAVSVNEADVYVGVLGINNFLAKHHGISNLKIASRFDMLSNGQRFAVRKDWPEFVSILNKTLDSIHEREKLAIFNNWIPISKAEQGALTFRKELTLTEEEVAWIRNHPDISLGVDPEFAPFEYFSKEGVYSGIASEYIKILNVRLGLNMRVIPGIRWNEAVEKAKIGEIDILPCVGIT